VCYDISFKGSILFVFDETIHLRKEEEDCETAATGGRLSSSGSVVASKAGLVIPRANVSLKRGLLAAGPVLLLLR